jgi:hypothetical protein
MKHRRTHQLHYDDCTIPPGVTAREWRARKPRQSKRAKRGRIRALIARRRAT